MQVLRGVLRVFVWIVGIAALLAFVYLAYMNSPNTAYGLVAIAFLALIPAGVAQNKGGSFGAWWWFGFLLFIIALPCALLMKSDQTALGNREIDAGRAKVCPWCMSLIHPYARVCPHCQRDQPI
jgi:hypothetical protein